MKTYALAKHVVFRRTTNDLCMLFDRNRGVMYELNETASAAVAQLQGAVRSQEEILASLRATFDVDDEDLVADVDGFLGDFVEAGLLETTVA